MDTIIDPISDMPQTSVSHLFLKIHSFHRFFAEARKEARAGARTGTGGMGRVFGNGI